VLRDNRTFGRNGRLPTYAGPRYDLPFLSAGITPVSMQWAKKGGRGNRREDKR
jgi:hypothetical protein